MTVAGEHTLEAGVDDGLGLQDRARVEESRGLHLGGEPHQVVHRRDAVLGG